MPAAGASSHDHWCTKGHILLCVEGELHTELKDGRAFVLTPGMSYQVADDTHGQHHHSRCALGEMLFNVLSDNPQQKTSWSTGSSFSAAAQHRVAAPRADRGELEW